MVDNEYGEPRQAPNQDAVDAIDQTQTMPAALEELPPLAGGGPSFPAQSAYPQAPPLEQAGYGQPAYTQQPGYGQPAYGSPTYGSPAYGQQPTVSAAQYGEPAAYPPAGHGDYPGAYPPAAGTDEADQHTAVYPPVPDYASDTTAYQDPSTQQYPRYGQPGGYPPPQQPAPGAQYDQQPGYGQGAYGQPAAYGQPEAYGNQSGQGSYGASGASTPQQQYGYGQTPAGADRGYSGAAAGAGAPGATRASANSKNSHVGLWTLAVVAIVVLAIVAATFIVKPSFLFKKVLDHKAVEQTIEQQSQGSLTNVSCPANEKVKAGVTFQCTAANNKKVNVKIKDSKANYEWSPAS